jgi:hypothetical protein
MQRIAILHVTIQKNQSMKIFNVLLSFVIVMGITSCASSGKKKSTSEKNWTTIFDGKTTTGWRGYITKPHSLLQDGKLLTGPSIVKHQVPVKPEPVAISSMTKNLVTLSFHLNGKYPKAETAVSLSLHRKYPTNLFYKSSPEMQVLDNDKHPDAKLGVNGNRMAGSLYDLIPAKPQNTKAVGQWNSVKILVYQGTVVFNQNGANVVEFHLWTDDWKKMCANSKFADWPWFIDTAKEGYIGLQDHGNDVWFRNIKIRQL